MTKKNLTFFITSICFLFWACSSFALVTQYQEAIDAYKRKDYKTAYQLILPLAKKGYSKAQYSLGMMYEKGKGVNKDSDRAKKWFQYAADQGLAKAQKKLNSNQEGNPKTLDQNSIKLNTKNLENGLNALNKKNYATAHKLFLELAEQGNVDAQYNLGLMYGKGKGVKKDYRKAIKWWVLAANQGNGKAQTNLGWMYEIGIGVQKDAHKAAHWYQIASNQGIAKAQDKLNLLLNKTNKNSQENTASSSKDISNLNTGSVSSGKNTLDAARYSPDAFNKIGDDTNDLDRLHSAINASTFGNTPFAKSMNNLKEDTIHMISHILEIELVEDESFSNSDVNDDDLVDILDVVVVVNIILSNNNECDEAYLDLSLEWETAEDLSYFNSEQLSNIMNQMSNLNYLEGIIVVHNGKIVSVN